MKNIGVISQKIISFICYRSEKLSQKSAVLDPTRHWMFNVDLSLLSHGERRDKWIKTERVAA
jgi:hypothetical protein